MVKFAPLTRALSVRSSARVKSVNIRVTEAAAATTALIDPLMDAQNKQSQALQSLSEIMKNQHDTLIAIIGNMK